MPVPIVLPDPLVQTVVEVKILKLAELRTRRRKQFLDGANVVVHRPADIEKYQYFDGVAPLGAGCGRQDSHAPPWI